jgi:hypothetical protein
MPDLRSMNRPAIDMFVAYFAGQLREIGEVPNHLHRKTLLVAVLDTLSRAAVPHLKDKNRERFLGFIEGWGDWPEGARVSLRQLDGNLTKHPELAGKRLRHEVSRRLKEWTDGYLCGRIYRASDEPPKDELISFAASDEERRLVEDHTHLSLLWIYRNMLVHEFREPGDDMGVLGKDPSPYYMSWEDTTWALAYPTPLLTVLAERALANLKKHLEAKDLDPDTFYEFGSIWKRVVPKRR